MTRDQMAELFKKCAKNRGFSLVFDATEKSLVASHEFQSTNKLLHGYLLRRTILIHNIGDMAVMIDAEMNIPKRIFPAMKKLLEQLTQKDGVCTFLLKNNGNIRVIMRCGYADEIWEDEKMVDGLYDMPLFSLQYNAKKIIQTANKKLTFKEMLHMPKRKKPDVDPFELRYRYEHNFLPEWFYGKTEEFVSKVQENSFLYEKMGILYKDAGKEMKYSRDQYKVHPCRKGKEFSIICIDMPDPEQALLCFQIYLAYSNDYKKKWYFTVEKVGNSNMRVLCCWKLVEKKLSHVNYGQGYEDIDMNEKKIAEIVKDESQ